MTRDRHKIVGRIAKLLARNEANGATRPEAEACVALAHRLMLKHGITDDDIQAAGDHVRRIVRTGKSRPVELRYVACIVAEHFHVRALTGCCGAVWHEILFGRPHHVEIAEHVWRYLSRAFRDLWRAHRRRHGSKPGAKEAYCAGLATGLHDRLTAQKRRVAAADPAVCNAIVQVGSALERAMADEFGPHLRRERVPSTPVDRASALAGMMDSERIRLQPALASEVA